jgi:hypothetical protein
MLALGMLALGVATALGRNYCGRFTKAHALRAAHKLRVNWPKVRFTPADLAHGMTVEREHRNITGCSPTMSAKIALAHLRERPDYYRRLSRYVEVGSLNGSGLGTRWQDDRDPDWLKQRWLRGEELRTTDPDDLEYLHYLNEQEEHEESKAPPFRPGFAPRPHYSRKWKKQRGLKGLAAYEQAARMYEAKERAKYAEHPSPRNEPVVFSLQKKRSWGEKAQGARFSGLGTIPPAPRLEFPDQWKKWARITFAAGTPVKLIGPVGRPDATTTTNLLLDPEGAGYDEYIYDIEAGMRGVTTGRFSWESRVSVKIVDARDKWGSQRTDAIGRTVLVHAWYLEPLADNWVQKRKP